MALVSDASSSEVAPLVAVLDSFGAKEDGTTTLGLTNVLESLGDDFSVVGVSTEVIGF